MCSAAASIENWRLKGKINFPLVFVRAHSDEKACKKFILLIITLLELRLVKVARSSRSGYV